MIQGEVLAHRLGLIPPKIDPEMLECRREGEKFNTINTSNPSNTISITFKQPAPGKKKSLYGDIEIFKNPKDSQKHF